MSQRLFCPACRPQRTVLKYIKPTVPCRSNSLQGQGRGQAVEGREVHANITQKPRKRRRGCSHSSQRTALTCQSARDTCPPCRHKHNLSEAARPGGAQKRRGLSASSCS